MTDTTPQAGAIDDGNVEYWRGQAIYAREQARKYEELCYALDQTNARLTEALALLGVPANAEILDIVKIVANLAQMRGLADKLPEREEGA